MGGLIALAVVVVAYTLVASKLDRWWITGPMVFVAAGAILGPGGLDVLPLALTNETVRTITELTLALLLFSDLQAELVVVELAGREEVLCQQDWCDRMVSKHQGSPSCGVGVLRLHREPSHGRATSGMPPSDQVPFTVRDGGDPEGDDVRAIAATGRGRDGATTGKSCDHWYAVRPRWSGAYPVVALGCRRGRRPRMSTLHLASDGHSGPNPAPPG